MLENIDIALMLADARIPEWEKLMLAVRAARERWDEPELSAAIECAEWSEVEKDEL